MFIGLGITDFQKVKEGFAISSLLPTLQREPSTWQWMEDWRFEISCTGRKEGRSERAEMGKGSCFIYFNKPPFGKPS
jgi:hypothetical protein